MRRDWRTPAFRPHRFQPAECESRLPAYSTHGMAVVAREFTRSPLRPSLCACGAWHLARGRAEVHDA